MHGTPADEIDHDLGPAIYAACQFQSYVTRDKSEIVNQIAAGLYLDFLEARIGNLRRLEQDLNSYEVPAVLPRRSGSKDAH